MTDLTTEEKDFIASSLLYLHRLNWTGRRPFFTIRQDLLAQSIVDKLAGQ